MKVAFALAALASAASATCIHGTTLYPRQASGAVRVSNFTFDGLRGPLAWAGLKPENEACTLGHNQSPINIIPSNVTAVNGSTLGFSVHAYPHGAEFINLGTTVEVDANGTLVRGNKTYSLRQFHFHTPSEHRIENEYYPMEVHFVFQAEDASLSVLGFLIEVGSEHEATPLLECVFANIEEISEPGSKAETEPLDFSDLEAHLAESTVYQYGGSLTTPPCTEGIAWNVVREPLHVDYATFRKAKAVLKFNSRYTQNTPGGINLLDNARNILDKKA